MSQKARRILQETSRGRGNQQQKSKLSCQFDDVGDSGEAKTSLEEWFGGISKEFLGMSENEPHI